MNTQNVYLEHANISVRNLDKAIHFFQTAFPEFQIRGGGETNGRKWIHLGNEGTYLALNEKIDGTFHEKDYEKNGFNHIGFVVKNVNEIADRLLAEGFKRDYPKQIEESESGITSSIMMETNTNLLST